MTSCRSEKSRRSSIFKVLKFKYLNKTSAMISDDKITTIYYIVDEFFKEFNHVLKEYSLQDQKIKKRKKNKLPCFKQTR